MVAEREADGAGGEIVHRVPHSRRNQHAFVGAVHPDHHGVVAIGKMQVERAGNGYQNRSVLSVGMTAAGLAAGHVVDVEDTFYRKRHMATFLNKRKVAAWITNFGKFKNLYFVKKSSHLAVTSEHLLFILIAFKLRFESEKSEIESLLESVGGLGSEKILSGHEKFHTGLLVHS